MSHQSTAEAAAYAKHKNLKLAADEIGLQWQVLYSRLREQGIPVTGDKSRYGSIKDKLASKAEALFAELVPCAVNMNESMWQAPVDFDVDGIKVDVKASRLTMRQKHTSKAMSWAFSMKKQSTTCGFFCLFCYGDEDIVHRILLIPREMAEGVKCLSVSPTKSKWLDYEVEPSDLPKFFNDMARIQSRPNTEH